MKTNRLTLAAIAGLALTASSANAVMIGQLGVLDDSTGLVAGDQYRLTFVTSSGTPFTSSDIDFYNSFVQGIAAAAGHGSVAWNIIGSTEAVDARDNTGTNPDQHRSSDLPNERNDKNCGQQRGFVGWKS